MTIVINQKLNSHKTGYSWPLLCEQKKNEMRYLLDWLELPFGANVILTLLICIFTWWLLNICQDWISFSVIFQLSCLLLGRISLATFILKFPLCQLLRNIPSLPKQAAYHKDALSLRACPYLPQVSFAQILVDYETFTKWRHNPNNWEHPKTYIFSFLLKQIW